jgi:hypothetical protein
VTVSKSHCHALPGVETRWSTQLSLETATVAMTQQHIYCMYTSAIPLYRFYDALVGGHGWL